ncbi:flagellar motor protein MotD [Mariniblastus fucicola]|uniref:Flagellar motor protein MotD n=1 Tax=Mariniblastus fucicola TaxID=980251 RepID=A0A5B9PCT6_9BACT|nr:flagellar motor protein MotD [Mariniblastus fucicola]
MLFTQVGTVANLRRGEQAVGHSPIADDPIMDDGMTKETTHWNLARQIVSLCAILLMALTGCQPQSRTSGGLFGMGNQSTFNSNSSFNRSSFNNPFGSFANNTGAAATPGAFTPSSPFGQFSPSSGTWQLPNATGSVAANPAGVGQLGQPGMAREYDRISQQIGAYDADNQLLNTEVATLKQKLELANQYNQTLKQQLADTSDRVLQTGNQQKIEQQQFASMKQQIQQLQQRVADQDRLLAQSQQQGPNWQGNGNNPFQNSNFQNNSGTFQNSSFSSTPGSATIRANNGLMQKLNSINIPGGNARMDGDIIRIEFPTDRLFTSGSYRIQAAQLPLLQNIASTIRQSFPKQIVGIEAHWDGTPLSPPGTTDHQLTATQSLAVFDELVRLGLPSRQLFTMAMASNRPRHRQQNVGGVSPNRRIELVIYPESYDGS